jgi:thioredoxin-related protein
MKKAIFITAIFLMMNLVLMGQGKNEKVKWYTFEEAVELSKKNPKKIFIDVYTDWCGWCKRLDRETFSHPVIAKYLNESFYAVKFDAESTDPIEFGGQTFVNEGGQPRNPHQLAIALLQGKMGYPSMAYMNEDLQLITVVQSYQTPKEIEPILSYFANDTYKTVGWTDFQTQFVSEIKK